MTPEGPLQKSLCISGCMKLNVAPTKLVSNLCQSQGGLSLHSIPLHLENEDKIHSENGTNY